jgi:hypothetical protein
LDKFRLDDYRRFDDGGKGMERLFRYVTAGVEKSGGKVVTNGASQFAVHLDGAAPIAFSRNRDEAKAEENLALLGLEHPLVERFMREHRSLGADGRALVGHLPGTSGTGVLTIWLAHVHGGKRQYHQRLVTLAANPQGERLRQMERQLGDLRLLRPADHAILQAGERHELLHTIRDMLRRELSHLGLLNEGESFSSRLLAWIEVA